MHEIHHTEGFILKSTNSAEANKLYWIFTKKFGTIMVAAQSVRAEKSKLKGHLHDYGHITLDVVRGRELWRITNAQMLIPVPFSLPFSLKRLYARTLDAIFRLHQVEEPHEKLYEHLVSFLAYLEKETISPVNAKYLDTVSLVRILSLLGYREETESMKPYISGSFREALELMNEEINTQLIQESQEALKQSHL